MFYNFADAVCCEKLVYKTGRSKVVLFNMCIIFFSKPNFFMVSNQQLK